MDMPSSHFHCACRLVEHVTLVGFAFHLEWVVCIAGPGWVLLRSHMSTASAVAILSPCTLAAAAAGGNLQKILCLLGAVAFLLVQSVGEGPVRILKYPCWGFYRMVGTSALFSQMPRT